MKSLVAFIILIASSCAWSATSDVSIYQLHIGLTNQDNKEIGLDVYRGQSTLITMFYGSCANVCPLLIETLRSI
ncbi:MAG TPA: SCO family protein, partial [Steroidobacteraceae bacterium]|nr:SCO family protein [Steroidobacteraceae bacterium]